MRVRARRVHTCTGMRVRVGDVYTPTWVEGALCTGGFVHLYMRVGVRTSVCVSFLCTECIRLSCAHACTRVFPTACT